MPFLERCPGCNALVHFRGNECNNCRKSFTEEERNSYKAQKISENLDKKQNEKYPFLQLIISFMVLLSFMLFIAGVAGILHGYSSFYSSDYLEDRVTSVLIIFFSVFGGIFGGIALYIAPAIIQVLIDIEKNGRKNNQTLKKLIELFKN